ncbi:uncharacterized protein LOC125027166 isoform X2 [Penaeus chinensis]|uniref:uncharacterized protein LOC125027166 isoform X2 n=1 Tax=Penaeus chinensis TaxID=139456 RepID=UPI001FB7F726|nr:uncharacterized protein LOC125027166 isoform X2 [Penaeus chinensis]
MQPPHLAQFPPLHTGRSFICYRDVNKAIEKHRELYGLRLVLKRAVKLENYCLTVDQMRDLNFRLKYGELVYQCSVDNGRPGRPGNDERCPRLVRLRLSPDARTLVVYDTHTHEPPKSPGQFQSLSPPCPIPEPAPALSEGVESSPPSGQQPSPSTPRLPLPNSQRVTTTPERNQTPTSAHGNSPEKMTTTPSAPAPKVIEKAAVKPVQKQLTQKTIDFYSTPKAEKLPVKPVEKFIAKSAEKAVTKPPEKVTKPAEKVAVKPPEKISSKSTERAVGRPSERVAGRPADKGNSRQTERCVGRPPVRVPQRTNERGNVRSSGTVSSTSGNVVGSYPKANGVGRPPLGINKKVHKGKRTKSAEPSLDLTSLAPLDTELGFSEKQQLAHGVLLRLLRITSQLPMIEFTHALETLEMLTDAFKLEQRVNLTINHDHEEETNGDYLEEMYEDRDMETEDYNHHFSDNENGVSSTTSEHQVAIAQLDGQGDGVDETSISEEVESRESLKRAVVGDVVCKEGDAEYIGQSCKVPRLSM